MKLKYCFALLAAHSVLACATQPEMHSCSFVATSAESFHEEVKLSLEVVDGRATKLLYEVLTSDGTEGGGYTCEFDSSRTEIPSTWNYENGASVVRSEEAVFIVRLGPDISVSARNYGALCGFKAMFPPVTIIPKGKKVCAFSDEGPE